MQKPSESCEGPTIEQAAATGRRSHRLSSLPTASGGIARAAYARANKTGLDLGPLLQKAGLTRHQIEVPNARISVKSQVSFLNQVSDVLEDDFLGFHLAQSVDLRKLGLIYYVLASSSNLANALTRLVRYSTVSNEGVLIAFNQEKHLGISFEYAGIARGSDRHQIEFFIAILLRLCRELTGRHLVPQSVRLTHRRVFLPPDLKALFGCEVQFGARGDQVIFPLGVRDVSLTYADPYLNSLLEQYCEEILKTRGAKRDDWTSRVENAIAPLLPHREATIEGVARRFGVTVRTLTRRLREEDTNFAKILQNLRLQLARKYLRESGMSVTQVAWLLGYGEPSAFSHAFKRWTGSPPRRSIRSI